MTVARRPLGVPALDLTSISAGGGSIAAVDQGGFLTVGPEKRRRRSRPRLLRPRRRGPTVTDADLVLGFLNPDYFLGGTQRLDMRRARAAIAAKIATPLGMSFAEAAAGIRRIVDMRMADEVRVYAAKRGVDARDFTLLPFGGAGAVHAAAVAEELGVARILVPPRPGAFSALGLLCSDVVHDYVRSELRPMAQVTPDHAEAIFRALERRAAAELAEEGLGDARASRERALDMRYTGQGYELTVSLAGLKAPLTHARSTRRADASTSCHARLHFHAASDRPVEIVSYRLRVRVAAPKYVPAKISDEKSAHRARERGQGVRAGCASMPRARRARGFSSATGLPPARGSKGRRSSSSSTPPR